MKILVLLTFTLLYSFKAEAKLIKVAVIDTGLATHRFSQANLCIGEHLDLSGEGLNDYNGHGTNVTGLIVANAGDPATYCVVLIKAFAMNQRPIRSWVDQALIYAASIKADVVNISGGGYGGGQLEETGIRALLANNKIIVAAAGNDKTDLNVKCNYYPACYSPQIVVVGATEQFSNTGKVVDMKISGKNLVGFGITMTGTSQATAVITGRIIKSLVNKKKVQK